MSIVETFASHPKASFWSSKNIQFPNDVPLYYYKKFWFNCDKCPHDFYTNLNSIARLNTWCPYCANKKICTNYNCIICTEKSFASSDKVVYLTKDNSINPRNVFKSSKELCTFNCKKGHPDFKATLNNISSGKWCKLCGFISSFKKQTITIEEFLSRTKDKYGSLYDYSKVVLNGIDRLIIILCNIHGDFEQSPWNHLNMKYGCEKCAIISRGLQNRYTFDEFVIKANSIHTNKYDYSVSKNVYETLRKKIPIKCIIHGVFIQTPSVHLQGCGCPLCKNKTEGQLLEYLQKKNIKVTSQFKLDSCKKKFHLPFDFELPLHKIIIELDGRQHFGQVLNWDSPEKTIKRDIYKMQKAETEGYKIIRIFQEDVYNTTEAWLDENLLPEIQSEDRTHVFISTKEDLYDEHIKLYESGEEIVLDEEEDEMENLT